MSEIGRLSTPYGLERSHSPKVKITVQELQASLRASRSAFSSVTPIDLRDPHSDPQTRFPHNESIQYGGGRKKQKKKKRRGRKSDRTQENQDAWLHRPFLITEPPLRQKKPPWVLTQELHSRLLGLAAGGLAGARSLRELLQSPGPASQNRNQPRAPLPLGGGKEKETRTHLITLPLSS